MTTAQPRTPGMSRSWPSATSRIRRCPEHGIAGGVAAGIAEHLDADPTVVRLVLVALAFVGGVGLPLYLAAWLLVPARDTDTSIAEELVSRLRAA